MPFLWIKRDRMHIEVSKSRSASILVHMRRTDQLLSITLDGRVKLLI